MDEYWTPVIGLGKKYYVSTHGKIWSSKRKIILKPKVQNNGYLSTTLFDTDGKKFTKSVHRTVAESFIENPLNLPQINHKDECKANNRADNLEWCTASYNVGYGNGAKQRALKERNGLRGIPVLQYSIDGNLIKRFISERGAARALGCNASNIRKCCQMSSSRYQVYGFLWRYENGDIKNQIQPYSGCLLRNSKKS